MEKISIRNIPRPPKVKHFFIIVCHSGESKHFYIQLNPRVLREWQTKQFHNKNIDAKCSLCSISIPFADDNLLFY